MDEVAAFEELVGSHGGLGGGQAHPFVLRPTDLPWPDDEVSAPRRSTASCAAGSRSSARRTTRVERLADAERRHAHAGRRARELSRERLRRVAQDSAVTPAVPSGRKVPQWIGITTCGATSADRSRRAGGVEVAGPERRAPAPDRHQRDVHAAAQLLHRRVERRCRRRTRCARRGSRARRARRGGEGGGRRMPGLHRLDLRAADGDRVAGAQLADAAEVEPAQQRAPRRSARPPRSPRARAGAATGGRGGRGAACEISTASTGSTATAAPGIGAWRRRCATRPRSTGSVSSRTPRDLQQDGRVAEPGDASHRPLSVSHAGDCGEGSGPALRVGRSAGRVAPVRGLEPVLRVSGAGRRPRAPRCPGRRDPRPAGRGRRGGRAGRALCRSRGRRRAPAPL